MRGLKLSKTLRFKNQAKQLTAKKVNWKHPMNFCAA
jgi:hypothetical protein